MAMAIQDQGEPAVSLTGGQIGIVTDSTHTKARIRKIDTERIRRELDAGKIVVAAGFQGVDGDFNITTLGRGGSDTTATALAAVLRRGRVRDLHRRRRGLHDRSAAGIGGPQDGANFLRRNAGAGQPGRRRHALAVDRVRQEIPGPPPRPPLLFGRRGHVDCSAGRRHSRGERDGPGPQRGPRQPVRHSRSSRRDEPDLHQDGRAQDPDRHGRAGRRTGGTGRSLVHRPPGRPGRHVDRSPAGD